MGARFDSTSSRYLSLGSPPITTVPFTIALWVYPFSGSTTTDVWTLTNTSQINVFELYTETSQWKLNSFHNGSTSIATTSVGTCTTRAWHYILARCITSTNRRLSVLNADGTVSHGQSTTSRTPLNINKMLLGAYQTTGSVGTFFSGYIAEFWVADIDVLPGGGAMSDAMLRQYANYGPFSLPQFTGANIIEYNSLYSSVPPSYKGAESFIGKRGMFSWVNNNDVKAGPHPPLAEPYQRGSARTSPIILV